MMPVTLRLGHKIPCAIVQVLTFPSTVNPDGSIKGWKECGSLSHYLEESHRIEVWNWFVIT